LSFKDTNLIASEYLVFRPSMENAINENKTNGLGVMVVCLDSMYYSCKDV